jgi:hypothetical protein
VVDKEKIEELFVKLSDGLKRSTRLCLFGSSPAVFLGQPSRQTQDLDVWRPGSTYDATDLKRVMDELGVLWNPMSPPKQGQLYMQVVQPGVVNFPHRLETAPVYQKGNLTVVMPTPVLLSAAKLVRASPRDIQDICWWMQARSISLRQLEQNGINRLENAEQRERARRELVTVRLHMASA